MTKTLEDDNTAYLFLVVQPTINIRMEKNEDTSAINNKLYSISQIARLGPQIKLIQNR